MAVHGLVCGSARQLPPAHVADLPHVCKQLQQEVAVHGVVYGLLV